MSSITFIGASIYVSLTYFNFPIASCFEGDIFNQANYGGVLDTLMIEIIKKQFEPPGCDVILVNDDRFSHQMLRWVSKLNYPIYSLSLHVHGLPLNPNVKWVKDGKSSRPSCSTVVIACQSIETCQPNHDSRQLEHLRNILESERRVYIFIMSETTSSLDSITPNSINSKRTLEILASINNIFGSLRVHFTLIRKLKPKHVKVSASPRDVYQTITWTPNWLPGGSPILSNVWTNDEGFLFKKRLFISLKQLSSGAPIKLVVSSKRISPAFDMLQNDTSTIRGIEGALINLFVGHFRFNLSVIQASDLEYGTELEDGSWSGAIGYVVRREADFAAGHLTFTSKRRKADVQVGPAFYILQAVAVCTIPEALPRWRVLSLPFKPRAWASIIVCSVVVIGLLELLQVFFTRWLGSTNPGYNWDGSRGSRMEKSWLSWIHAYASIVKTNIPDRVIPRYTAFLLIYGPWLLFTFVISSIFCQMLVGYLSFPPLDQPISSLADLINRAPWTISSLVEETIQNSEHAVDNHLYKNRLILPKSNDSWSVDVEGYLFINSSDKKACYVTESSRSKYYIQKYFTNRHKEVSLYFSAESSFFIAPTGWYFRGDTDFLLIKYIHRLSKYYRDFGLLQKNEMSMYPLYQSWNYVHTETKPLTFSELYIIFCLLLIGFGVSTVVFMLEIIINKWKSRKTLVGFQLPTGLQAEWNEIFKTEFKIKKYN